MKINLSRLFATFLFAVVLIGSFFLLKACDQKKYCKQIETMILNGAIILDVRTPAEYAEEHIEGSLNIELNRLKSDDLESLGLNKRHTYITCCVKGKRSADAAGVLTSQGYRAYNGGSYKKLNPKH